MKKKTYIIMLLVLIVDQLTKFLVPVNLNIKIIKNFFYLTYTQNFGAAWGIFSGDVLILIVVSMVALLVINRYLLTSDINKLDVISFGLLMGGILGNLCDRLFRGYVVDFLNFYIFNYDYPVFNIADIGVVLGIFLMFISVWRGDRDEDKSRNRRRNDAN